jgi:hypothetical protein
VGIESNVEVSSSVTQSSVGNGSSSALPVPSHTW